MAEITAALVKELREKTGAGMMDCKKALAETEGDLETAVDWLRKKGLAAAAKKAGRVAAEGLVGVAADGTRGRRGRGQFRDRLRRPQREVPELRRRRRQARARERSDVRSAGRHGRSPVSGRRRRQAHPPDRHHRREHVAAPRGVALGRARAWWPPTCTMRWRPASARSACWWRSNSTGDKAKLAALGKQLAMHVAAANPQSLTIADVDPAVARARARRCWPSRRAPRGKPDEIIAKMVEGRLRKFYEEVVLLEQTFVIDGESKVKAVLAAAAKEVGAPVEIAGFLPLRAGRGHREEAEGFRGRGGGPARTDFEA